MNCMNKKRIIAIFAILCLIVTAGCGAGGSGEKGTSAAGQEGTTAAPSGQDQEETTDAGAAPSGQAGEMKARPVIEKSRLVNYERKDNDTPVLVEGSHDRIRISPDSREDYPALSDALDQIMNAGTKDYKKQIKEYREMREDIPVNAMGEEIPNSFKEKYYVRRADSQVLSLLERFTSYSGGAHGDTGYETLNLDASTGEEIGLSDVVRDQALLRKALKEELVKKYGKEIFFEDLDENIRTRLEESEDMKPAWTLDPQGVTFYFSDYDVAPYASGTQNVTLLYSAHGDLFTDQYRPISGQGSISGFCDYADFSVDTDDDGEAESVSVVYSRNQDSQDIESFEVSVNGKTASVNNLNAYQADQYTVTTSGGQTFLYVWVSEENDYMTLHLFDISSGRPESAGSLGVRPNAAADEEDEDYSVYTQEITDPDHMVLQTLFNILSSYYAGKNYSVTDKPMPETSDPYYMVSGEITLKSKKEVTGDLVDEDGNVVEKSVKMPVGTSFTFYRTDGKDKVDTKLEDGKIFRITVEGDYPPMVNGVDANELFEQLFYAG